MSKQKKTNAMRILDKHNTRYSIYEYNATDRMNGIEIAQINNLDPSRVYKTLVTIGTTKEFYVFLVPVNKELNLKKAAKAANEKKIEMIPQKDLLRITGYIHGGCSPIGMKKKFKTFVNSDLYDSEILVFSGGKKGIQIQMLVEEFVSIVDAKIHDIT